jgi:hypothetical protein
MPASKLESATLSYHCPDGSFGLRLDGSYTELVGYSRMKTLIPYFATVLLVVSSVTFAIVRYQKRVEASISVAQSDTPTPEAARRAYDFINSIGVNTHLNYFDRIYGNFPLVEQELRSIGILHLRDGIHLQNDDYNRALYGRWIELSKLGIRFDAVLDPRSNLPPLTPALLASVDNLSGHAIESFEGPNELDIGALPDWKSVDRAYETSLFDATRSMPGSDRISVIGPSLAHARNGLNLGNISAKSDEGNLHPYPAAQMPSIVFPEQTDLAKIVYGDQPIVFTESGYHNALNDHHDQPGVSEAAAARYIPRLFLEDFARGIPRTYLYEFMDETANPRLTDNQLHWGLIRADGSEKPAFTAMKNLIDELHDSNEAAAIHQLAWTLNTQDEHLHHLLLQKSNGEFDLVLWQEVVSFDYKNQSDISNSNEAATLTLGRSARSVSVFQPSLQAQPLFTRTDSASVPLQIPDSPLVIKISLR